MNNDIMSKDVVDAMFHGDKDGKFTLKEIEVIGFSENPEEVHSVATTGANNNTEGRAYPSFDNRGYLYNENLKGLEFTSWGFYEDGFIFYTNKAILCTIK